MDFQEYYNCNIFSEHSKRLEMSSHSSNNSNADIEVINPEDLEESPPPEVESQSVPEDVENSTLVTGVSNI